MRDVDLDVVGDRLCIELSRKWVRLLSISSISRTGRRILDLGVCPGIGQY